MKVVTVVEKNCRLRSGLFQIHEENKVGTANCGLNRMGEENDDGVWHARVISTQIHCIPGTTSRIRRWSTSQLKIA